ncbi:RNA polymerase sigma factor [Bacteroides fragilis]|nr:RNA polymerase sigma factor [Bacteroides fragilis]
MKSNKNEFLKLLTAYQGIIHKVNRIYFRSEADREDNFQETVYQLWRSFPALQNKEKPASWIYTVAINTSISKVRKDSRIEFRDSPPDGEPVDPGNNRNRTKTGKDLSMPCKS